jgi:hypothetical protein
MHLNMLLQVCETNSLTIVLVTNYSSRKIPEKQVHVFSVSGS